MKQDYLIIDSGLFGAVIAYKITKKEKMHNFRKNLLVEISMQNQKKTLMFTNMCTTQTF